MAVPDAIILPAPLIDAVTTPPGKWAREHQAFRRLLPDLLQTHRGQFVAVHEGRVIASGQDKLAVALEAFRQVGNVSIHVGLVSDVLEQVVRSGVRRVVATAGGAS
jgi:hypothetical protein